MRARWVTTASTAATAVGLLAVLLAGYTPVESSRGDLSFVEDAARGCMRYCFVQSAAPPRPPS